MTDMGRRIARLRAAMGWTQDELAERVGVAPATVAAYEQGRRTKLETIQRIAAALKVETGVILGLHSEVDNDPAVEALLAVLPQLSDEAVGELLRLARLMARE